MLQKAEQAGTDKELALLCLRTTPISCRLPSPGLILMGRKLKGNLPVKIQNSDFSNSDSVREELQNRQDIQKMYHDRKSKDLPPLIPGQNVRIQNSQSGQWEKGKIVSKCEEPRSYLVKNPEGHTLRRNRIHLRESPQPHNVIDKDSCVNDSYCTDIPRQNESGVNEVPYKANTETMVGSPGTTRSGRAVKKPDRLDL